METRRHSRTGALLALLVLPVVAGLGWWGGRTSLPAAEKTADTGPVADAALASSGVSAPPSLDADAPRPRRPDAPLPDLATPLRDTWQDLKHHADAGDAGAACRLAAELEFCDGIRQRLDSASAMLANRDVRTDLPGASDEEIAARRRALTTGSERLLEQSRHCEGVPAFSPQDRVRYWRSAALGGNVAAMRHYAVGNAFRMNDTLDNLDALRVYRSEAEAIAQRAVAAGDLITAMTLASAYSPHRRGNRRYLLAQSVQPDAGRALALYLYVQQRAQAGTPLSEPMQRRMTGMIRTLEADLSPEALGQVRAQAARYPATAPLSPRERSLLTYVDRSGNTANINREDCAGG